MVPNTGFKGKETSAETDQLREANNSTHRYPDRLVLNTRMGLLTLTGVICKEQTFFSKVRKKVEMKQRALKGQTENGSKT